jgi:hypothetical protein
MRQRVVVIAKDGVLKQSAEQSGLLRFIPHKIKDFAG